MKSTFSVISIVVIAIFIVSCSESNSQEASQKFALYLLKNDTLKTEDIQELDVSRHVIRNVPVLDYDDIVAYQPDNHTIYLNDILSRYLDTDSLEVFSQLFGKPFVLIANGDRIYLGSFIPGISSWAPFTPKIVDYSVNNEEKSFIISGAAYYDEETFIDVRNDERIYSALRSKIID